MGYVSKYFFIPSFCCWSSLTSKFSKNFMLDWNYVPLVAARASLINLRSPPIASYGSVSFSKAVIASNAIGVPWLSLSRSWSSWPLFNVTFCRLLMVYRLIRSRLCSSSIWFKWIGLIGICDSSSSLMLVRDWFWIMNCYYSIMSTFTSDVSDLFDILWWTSD